MIYAAPKGTRDILPPETAQWQAIERLYSEVAELFGYGEIRIPTFESTEVFQRGVGDGTDIVQKEMYTFDDKGGRSITLRPEGTAGVVRSFVQRGMSSLSYPIKLYYMLNMFRYENVQEGRFREFHQLGLESFGAEGPESDAEIIAMLQLFFDRLGLKETHLNINSIGCPDCRAVYHEALKNYFRPHLPELCEDCRKRFDKNPLRILDCKMDRCKAVAQAAPLLQDYLDEGCRDHFEGLKTELDAMGLSYRVEPRLVRGLDYYTRTVFEYVSDHVGTQGTICGGGRYDKLVEALGGPSVPACGFAMGQERLLLEMAAQGVELDQVQRASVFIGSVGEAAGLTARRLAHQLRQRAVVVQTELCGRSVKGQMKYAGKSGLRFSMILGDNELSSGEAELKDMTNGEKTRVNFSDVETLLKALMRG